MLEYSVLGAFEKIEYLVLYNYSNTQNTEVFYSNKFEIGSNMNILSFTASLFL